MVVSLLIHCFSLNNAHRKWNLYFQPVKSSGFQPVPVKFSASQVFKKISNLFH
jgi:hypothetical protein